MMIKDPAAISPGDNDERVLAGLGNRHDVIGDPIVLQLCPQRLDQRTQLEQRLGSRPRDLEIAITPVRRQSRPAISASNVVGSTLSMK